MRVKEDRRRQAQRNALCISQTHRGLWFRADTLKGRVSGGHVNQAGVRKDIVLTRGQTKQTLTLPRVHVNSTETWQRSVSLPCKVCGEVEEEEGEGGRTDRLMVIVVGVNLKSCPPSSLN